MLAYRVKTELAGIVFVASALWSCGGPPARLALFAMDSVREPVEFAQGSIGLKFSCDISVDSPLHKSLIGTISWGLQGLSSVIPFEISAEYSMTGTPQESIDGLRWSTPDDTVAVGVGRLLNDVVCEGSCDLHVEFVVKVTHPASAPVAIPGEFQFSLAAKGDFGVDASTDSLTIVCAPPEILMTP